ncbi:hypothetical protein BJ508DRAFT_303858 [Ascobolus immersus RN42]|uniref:Uncharacterized protein n=1 Tax=Ascobolus immersus RN42 TaxID=1160509 RepID=A0A3N4IJS3_ASCIM|nr:hypothetical protein BJ508DRAFT_303858 [Ascobolus immersus RN42]
MTLASVPKKLTDSRQILSRLLFRIAWPSHSREPGRSVWHNLWLATDSSTSNSPAHPFRHAQNRSTRLRTAMGYRPSHGSSSMAVIRDRLLVGLCARGSCPMNCRLGSSHGRDSPAQLARSKEFLNRPQTATNRSWGACSRTKRDESLTAVAISGTFRNRC